MNRPLYYKLDDHTPVPIPPGMEVEDQFRDIDARRVAYTETPDGYVSTVFLVIDHNHYGSGPPVLFETLIEGGPWDGWLDRYTSWAAAEAGHAAALAMIHNDPDREGNE